MSPKEDIELVKDFVRRTTSAVSEGDVAAGTGLDVGSTKAALHVLMLSHRCTLQVHDDGTLVYDFGGGLVSLSRKSLREKIGTVGRWLWKGFSFVYKASLAVLLVAYALAFVALIIAAAVAASAASKDEGPAEGAFSLVGAIFRGIFEFMTYTPMIYGDMDQFGYPHGHYEPKAPVLFTKKAHDKGFVASVYDFVLGPQRVEPGPMAQRQEVAAFVRKNRGVLTVRDVQALSGLSRGEAEAFFARFVAEQDGVAEITENGALYATFEELLRSKTVEHDAPIELYWDEYEAPVELTGNTGTRNALIALIAAFNLTGAFTVMNMGTALGEWGMWLGAVPAVIFTLFFALPVLRAPVVWWKNRLQHANNIRKRVFRAVFGTRDEQLTSADIVERANEHAFTEEKLRVADIDELLGETMHEIGGELDVNARGETITDFTRLRIEEQAAEEHALEVEVESEVVFRTDEAT